VRRAMSSGEIAALGDAMAIPERELVAVVAALRLMTHAQLARMISLDANASPASSARATRRVLARLTGLRLLARLERRIGGARAGSAGYVYYLGPVGQRLMAYWSGQGLVRGRFRPEPGGRYVRHRLAVSGLYVELRVAAHAGSLDLLDFQAEPACWRRAVDGFGGATILKPDAYARIGLGAYEDSFFIEVDLGTESRSVIARKLRVYRDYFQSGSEQARNGVFPRVLLVANSQARRDLLVDLATRLPAEDRVLFTVATLGRALGAMTGQIDEDARHGSPEDQL
jgi:Replication-relaxation